MGAYDKLLPWQQAMLPRARLAQYNFRPYRDESYPQPNVWGLDDDGHRIVGEALFSDMAAAANEAAVYVQMLLTYLQSANGWAVEARTVTRISDTEFAVVGADLTTLVYKPKRAVTLIQGVASGFGWISGSVYEAGANRTIVTIVPQTEGLLVDAGLTAVWFGQDPSNAPMVEVHPVDPAQLEYLMW